MIIAENRRVIDVINRHSFVREQQISLDELTLGSPGGASGLLSRSRSSFKNDPSVTCLLAVNQTIWIGTSTGELIIVNDQIKVTKTYGHLHRYRPFYGAITSMKFASQPGFIDGLILISWFPRLILRPMSALSLQITLGSSQ